jgi:CRP-like cAMP-binding protein
VTSANEPNLEDLSKFLVSVATGDFIYRENDAGADMYIIRNGRVELLKQGAGGERRVAMLEAGDFFGETSLFEDHPRDMSARAVGSVELLRIDATTFDRLVQEAPEIPVRMLRKMCRRLREYQDQESRAPAIATGPRGAVLVDPTSNATFELASGESTIGRADPLTAFTPDIDLSSLDTQRTLSRRHATIVSRDGEYYVREEISTRNGTFVNGMRIQTGVDVKIASGDHVRFGVIETVFEIR